MTEYCETCGDMCEVQTDDGTGSFIPAESLLQRKLDVAMEYLRMVSLPSFFGCTCDTIAEEAFAKIKEMK